MGFSKCIPIMHILVSEHQQTVHTVPIEKLATGHDFLTCKIIIAKTHNNVELEYLVFLQNLFCQNLLKFMHLALVKLCETKIC